MDANDVHQHRRSTDTDEGQRHRVLEAVESTQAKFISRVLVPALLTALVAISGFIGTRLLAQLDEQGTDLDQVKSDVRNINTRLDEGVIRQVNQNRDDISELKTRVQTIERTVRTP